MVHREVLLFPTLIRAGVSLDNGFIWEVHRHGRTGLRDHTGVSSDVVERQREIRIAHDGVDVPAFFVKGNYHRDQLIAVAVHQRLGDALAEIAWTVLASR